MKHLYPRFLNNIREYHLVLPGDTIILGFSGGKDSVTLLYLLKELKNDIPFTLIAAYFNHRLRMDSSEEEQWIDRFCRGLSVRLVKGGKNVLEFKKDMRLNLEHAASLSRYLFFREISTRYKNAKVATAHTRSDLTETFFIKLLRGSGLQGLSSIYSKKENTIIRPLLLFSQDEIIDFLKRNKIEFYQDPTNEEDEFLRNKIRHTLVPEIEKIEPNVNDRVFQTVSIIQDEYEYFSDTANSILDKHLLLGIILPIDSMNAQHCALQRHIVREYIRRLKGNLLNIGFDHIETVRMQRTGKREIKGAAIPGIELKFHKGFIFPKDIHIPEYCYTVPGPGQLKIPEIGKRLFFNDVSIYNKPSDNYGIIMPFSAATFPLTVRNPRKGDKYMKINTAINQDVFEMIRASGIPSELRNLCPVVLNGDGNIIWVMGSPAADAFKVQNPKEKNFLEIK
jgi:tRNA(Ile)-lysidine synthase